MKRSRFLYLHPLTNPGKLAALRVLHTEYIGYLRICVASMIEKRRFKVPRSELKSVFPPAPDSFTVSCDLIASCQQHASGIVLGWVASKYSTTLKNYITQAKKAGWLTEEYAHALYTIGKHQIDKPWEVVTQDHIDLYWAWMLWEDLVGKQPTVGNRTEIRFTANTGWLKASRSTKPSFWVYVSSLIKGKGHTIKLPLLDSPYVSTRNQLVNSFSLQPRGNGCWRVQICEKEKVSIPKLPRNPPKVAVDVGYNVPAVDSNGVLYNRGMKKQFEAKRKKVVALRANRQQQGLLTNSPRLGALENDLSSLNKHSAGGIANRLVATYPGYLFILEDLNLSGLKGQKRYAYKALHNSLKTKARVVEVNPAYTSQCCPSCGYVNRKNRSGTKFKCRSCGRISHADVVGAVNLLGRSEDKEVNSIEDHKEVKPILEERYLRRRNSSLESKTGVVAIPIQAAPVSSGQRLTVGPLVEPTPCTASNQVPIQ